MKTENVSASTTPASHTASDAIDTADRRESIDLSELFAVLRRRMRTIMITVLACCLLVYIAVSMMTPIYEASAQVLIDMRERQSIDIPSVVAGLPSDTNSVDTEVQLIASPALAQRVIRNLSLDEDPEFNTALAEKKFNPISWLRSLAGGGEKTENLTEEELAERTVRKILERFQKRTTVERQGLTYVILVSYRSENPEKAARIANAIADAYLVDQLEAKFEATERVNNWLSERLATLREEVTAADAAVEQYRAEYGLLDADGKLINEQNLSQLNTQLIQARTNLAEARARYQQVRQLISSGSNLDTVGETLDSQTIRTLREQQAEVVRKKAELSTRYLELHPEMVKVTNELRDLNEQIEDEIQRIVTSLRNEVIVAQERVRVLETNLDNLQNESTASKQAQIQLRQLQREADASRDLYTKFLGRFQETNENKSLQEADARIIARATAPVDPISPRKALSLAVALAVSSVLGLGIAFMLEQLDRRFRDLDHVEDVLKLPILATVPKLTPAQLRSGGGNLTPPRFLLHDPQSGFAEAFRTLDACIWLTDVDQPPRSVLFTSSLPGEGKSTSALCYARSVARSDTSCVLVDADLRDPTIATMLGQRNELGLVDVLAGLTDLDDALIKDEATGLAVLTRGSRATYPQDLFGSKAFDSLLEELCDRFDLVVFDSAPILPVADTRILARKVDSCVVVLQWHKTTRAQAAACVNYLKASKAQLAGILLEQVERPIGQQDSYGDMRYYHGRYGNLASDGNRPLDDPATEERTSTAKRLAGTAFGAVTGASFGRTRKSDEDEQPRFGTPKPSFDREPHTPTGTDYRPSIPKPERESQPFLDRGPAETAPSDGSSYFSTPPRDPEPSSTRDDGFGLSESPVADEKPEPGAFTPERRPEQPLFSPPRYQEPGASGDLGTDDAVTGGDDDHEPGWEADSDTGPADQARRTGFAGHDVPSIEDVPEDPVEDDDLSSEDDGFSPEDPEPLAPPHPPRFGTPPGTGFGTSYEPWRPGSPGEETDELEEDLESFDRLGPSSIDTPLRETADSADEDETDLFEEDEFEPPEESTPLAPPKPPAFSSPASAHFADFRRPPNPAAGTEPHGGADASDNGEDGAHDLDEDDAEPDAIPFPKPFGTLARAGFRTHWDTVREAHKDPASEDGLPEDEDGGEDAPEEPIEFRRSVHPTMPLAKFGLVGRRKRQSQDANEKDDADAEDDSEDNDKA